MNTDLRSLIRATKGKFFTITFIKKDGTTRTINGKDKYFRLLASPTSPRSGINPVSDAGYESFVNRNKESWAAAKDEATLHFKCGSIERSFSV